MRAAAMRAVVVAAAAGPAAAALPPLGGLVGAISPEEIEVPRLGFPGMNEEASHGAWPSGVQPKRLQYWPQLNFGLPNRTLLGCWKTQVLHDTAKQWPGLCVNLAPNTQVAATEAACRSFCEQEPRCPVWQFVNQTVPGECWVGFGTNCANRKGRGADISVQASQRLVHGDIKVLMSLAGWKVHNLYQIGMFESGDEALSVERCKAWCYSDIGCEYWQYSPTAGGCFVDAPMFSTERNSKPGKVAQYPLTTAGGASPDSAFKDGEFIAHFCPPLPAQTSKPPEAPVFPAEPRDTSTSSGGFINLWILIPVIILASMIAAFFCYQQAGGATSKKKKKGNDFGARDAFAVKGGYEDDKQPLMDPLGPYPQPPPPPPGYPQSSHYGQRPGLGAGSSYQQPPQQQYQQQQQQQQQPQMAPTTYGPGVGRGMPPPTMVMDAGAIPGGSAMAPTVVSGGGVPFPMAPTQVVGGGGVGY